MHLHKLALALVTLGLSLAPLAAGCNGNVQVEGEDPRCPASFPDGKACSEEGLVCDYRVSGCDLVYACLGGQWADPTSACAEPCMWGQPGSACLAVGESCSFSEGCHYEEWSCDADHAWDVWYEEVPGDCCYGECECQPYYCPPDPPAEGASCDPCYEDQFCPYGALTACGEQEVVLGCSFDGVWEVVTPAVPCDCSDHAFIEECEADPACRYLHGSCEAPTLAEGGCFPKDDCSADTPCPAGTACTTVNANVCTFDPCIECNVVSLCL